MRIGFIGAGNIGQGLARLALSAGYDVSMSNSRGPATLQHLVDELGVQASTVDETLQASDHIVLAVPFARIFDMDPAPFVDHIVWDTNNYYPMRDGGIQELDAHLHSTSELVQRHLAGAMVVKAFNAILAADLVSPFGLPGGLRALPIATDYPNALASVNEFHERAGLEMVPAGSLADSWRFERAKPAYCIPFGREDLLEALKAADRVAELPHNSWHRSDI